MAALDGTNEFGPKRWNVYDSDGRRRPKGKLRNEDDNERRTSNRRRKIEVRCFHEGGKYYGTKIKIEIKNEDEIRRSDLMEQLRRVGKKRNTELKEREK